MIQSFTFDNAKQVLDSVQDSLEHNVLKFVVDSTIKSFRASHYSGVIDKQVYAQNFREVLLRVLNKSVVLVDCDETNQRDFFAHAILESDCLHFVYVKQQFRHQRRATELLDHYFMHYEPLTKYSLKTSSSHKFLEHYCRVCTATLNFDIEAIRKYRQ